MLDGSDLGPPLLKARGQTGIADTERVSTQIDRRVEINAAEYHAAIGLRRAQRQRDLLAGMKPDAGCGHQGSECALS